MNTDSPHWNNLSENKLLSKIAAYISKKKHVRIVTVNSEYLLEMRKNEIFRRAISRADCFLCDGVGVKVWMIFKEKKILPRISGVDLCEGLFDRFRGDRLTLCLVNRIDGLSISEELTSFFAQNYSTITTHILDSSATSEKDWEVRIKAIQKIQPDIVLCNFGMPEQEYFLSELSKIYPRGVMMGVGSAFDYWTGKQKRAPLWMRTIGGEWLWRFMKNPWRIRRFWKRMFR